MGPKLSVIFVRYSRDRYTGFDCTRNFNERKICGRCLQVVAVQRQLCVKNTNIMTSKWWWLCGHVDAIQRWWLPQVRLYLKA